MCTEGTSGRVHTRTYADPMATSIRYFFKVSTSWHGVEQELFSPAIFVLETASSPQKLSKCVARCVSRPAAKSMKKAGSSSNCVPQLGFKLLSGCKCEDDEEWETTTWKEFGPAQVASLAEGFKVYLS